MAYQPRSQEGAADEIGPMLTQAHELLGMNEMNAARELLERGIAREPKNQKLQSLLGMTCFKMGQLDRAAELYELLVRENPVESTLRINLGLVYLKLGSIPLAVREFQAAVDLSPEHKKAQNYLGLALTQAGEYAAAREAFLAAGSVAMVEKMDRTLAEEGRDLPRRGHASPPTGKAGFAEIEHDAAPELEAVHTTPRPVTSPAGSVIPRPSTQEQRAPATTRPSTAVLGSVLPLSELAQALRVDHAPANPFEVRGEVAAIRVGGEVLTRLEPLVSLLGKLEVAPEMKRFRGRATDKPFGTGRRRFTRVSGQGLILVATQGKIFLPLELGDGAAYFVEDAVFAFEEALTFENGRLPGKTTDLNLLLLRGRGKVLLALDGPMRSLPVTGDAPTIVSVDRLVGWLGSLTPKRVAPLADADGETASQAVELTGEGFALLTLPEQSAGHVRPG
jgi:uncharacterized protein (AIM24 family)